MHRLVPLVGILAAQLACSSSWTLQVSSGNVCTEDRKLAWWEDADGDGWGNGVAEDGSEVAPIMECDGYQDATLVRNGLDCDDASPAIGAGAENILGVTASVAGFCPEDIVYNPDDLPVDYLGFRADGDEYVAYYGSTPVDFGSLANANCSAWGGIDKNPDSPTYNQPTGHLATFETTAEATRIMDELELVLGTTPYAAYIGIGSINGDGTPEDWAWQIDDGATDQIFNNPGWCDGVPPDSTRVSQIALVYDGTSWCLGSAELAGPPYERFQAHYICERPSPNPQQYDYFPPLQSDTGQ